MNAHVFVGLSGGVDSAVSAALLKEQGYAVTGVFIKIWSPEFIECTWREDRLDAMRVAAALEIPFKEIDLSETYRTSVIEKMTTDYARGVTPNPDVLCNRHIKFGAFAEWAFQNGADYIATGHYARVRAHGATAELLRGIDVQKDQSYFLHAISREHLAKSIFPIGGMEKREVRELAGRFGLPNAKRPDSQGLCFVGEITLPEFLSRFLRVEEGQVLDVHGHRIGTHNGAALYTLGQRHGFRIDGATDPRYVIATDVAHNTITVSVSKEDAMSRSVELEHTNWLAEPDATHENLSAQARYRESPFAVSLEKGNKRTKVTFNEAHIAAPGQSLALYDGDRCIGGGEIVPHVNKLPIAA